MVDMCRKGFGVFEDPCEEERDDLPVDEKERLRMQELEAKTPGGLFITEAMELANLKEKYLKA